MQITLVQTEIETAIREYVHTQINVREGMKIDIVLKATRGDEGTTAIIDIVADSSPEPVKEVANTAKVARVIDASAKAKPASIEGKSTLTKVELKEPENAAAATPAAAAAAAGATTQDAQTAGSAGENQTQEEQAQDKSPDTEQTEQVGGATDSPAPRKSLFGDMNRPKNS